MSFLVTEAPIPQINGDVSETVQDRYIVAVDVVHVVLNSAIINDTE